MSYQTKQSVCYGRLNLKSKFTIRKDFYFVCKRGYRVMNSLFFTNLAMNVTRNILPIQHVNKNEIPVMDLWNKDIRLKLKCPKNSVFLFPNKNNTPKAVKNVMFSKNDVTNQDKCWMIVLYPLSTDEFDWFFLKCIGNLKKILFITSFPYDNY